MLHWRTSLSRDGKKMLTRHYLISRAWLVPFTLTRQRAGVGQAREDGRATRQAMDQAYSPRASIMWLRLFKGKVVRSIEYDKTLTVPPLFFLLFLTPSLF